jgi:alkylation response protein AidB-like acyl-CoA dehydrogenase
MTPITSTGTARGAALVDDEGAGGPDADAHDEVRAHARSLDDAATGERPLGAGPSANVSAANAGGASAGGANVDAANAVTAGPGTAALPATRFAEHAERALGDPGDPRTVFNYADCAALDVTEAFPDRICAHLDALGVPEHYVPAALGGALVSYEHLLQLIRVLARRDLTVAIGHGKTFLGSVSAWVAEANGGVGAGGSTASLAAAVRDGAQVCLALTERGHGSDLMAGELTAAPHDGGYRLSGEKWLINNATRGRFATVLARTSPVGGPRGFSLFLVDKSALPEGSYRCLPKVRTLGIRGADISGLVFEDAPVGPGALLGTEGGGSELLLKALQITRTLCPALSLGAADHALRLAVRFTRERQLYGRTLAELPLTRRTLAETYADLLLAEAVATVAARSIHGLPSELSVTAATVKYLVPSLVDDVLGRLGSLLGARSFLAGHYAHGMFQKIERDHRIVGIFDGNTLVNLYSLVAQFRTLARNFLGPIGERPRLGLLFDLRRPLPDACFEQLTLFSRYGSSVLGTLPASAAALRAAARTDPALAGAAHAAERLEAAATALHRRIRGNADTVTGASEESFAEARRYALCFAGAAAAGLWLHSHAAAEAAGPAGAGAGEDTGGEDTGGAGSAALWRDARWLHAALTRVLDRLEPGTAPQPGEGTACDAVLDVLQGQYDRGEAFSLLTWRVADAPPGGRPATGADDPGARATDPPATPPAGAPATTDPGTPAATAARVPAATASRTAGSAAGPPGTNS